MLEQLKAEVCKANLDLVRKGLDIETWATPAGIFPDSLLVTRFGRWQHDGRGSQS